MGQAAADGALTMPSACLICVFRSRRQGTRPSGAGPRHTNTLRFVFCSRSQPNRYCSQRNTPPEHRYRLSLCWGLMALCVSFLVIGNASWATDDVSSQPKGITTVSADQAIATLLLRAEEEIVAGRTLSPPKDNALDTWVRVLATASPASPGAVRAIWDFAANLRNRADVEKTAGRLAVSAHLIVFAGMAADWLTHADAAPASPTDPQEAASQRVPQSRASPGPVVPSVIDPVVVPSTIDPVTGDAPTVGASAGPGPSSALQYPPKADADPTHAELPVGQPVTPSAPLIIRAADMNATQPATPAGKTEPVLAAQPVRPATAASPSPEQSMAEFYTKRGDEMLAIKDISAARKFYEYAANAGSASAAMAIARTYDPAFLGQLQVVGLRPDPELTATWYRKAAALGDPNAAAWLYALSANAASSGRAQH